MRRRCRSDGFAYRWPGQEDPADYLLQIPFEDRLWVEVCAKRKKMTPAQFVDRFISIEPARIRNGPTPEALREDVLVRDHATCQICGTNEGPMHVDHKHPRSRGGITVERNLWTLCRRCNLRKGARTVQEYLAP